MGGFEALIQGVGTPCQLLKTQLDSLPMGAQDHTATPQQLTTDSTAGFVAVVDDDEHIAQAITLWLDMLGTRSQVFDSGESLFEALRASPVAPSNGCAKALKAAILDLNLPGSNGIEIAHQLRRDHPKLPIVLVSAVHAGDLSRFGVMPEGVRFFKKPFELEELELALQLQQ